MTKEDKILNQLVRKHAKEFRKNMERLWWGTRKTKKGEFPGLEAIMKNNKNTISLNKCDCKCNNDFAQSNIVTVYKPDEYELNDKEIILKFKGGREEKHIILDREMLEDIIIKIHRKLHG